MANRRLFLKGYSDAAPNGLSSINTSQERRRGGGSAVVAGWLRVLVVGWPADLACVPDDRFAQNPTSTRARRPAAAVGQYVENTRTFINCMYRRSKKVKTRERG